MTLLQREKGEILKVKEVEEKKKRRWVLFKRLRKEAAWKWKFLGSAFKWKRPGFRVSLIDDLVFKIVSVFEGIFLVTSLCFFFLCCGCHF